jgi:hypothetical protein
VENPMVPGVIFSCLTLNLGVYLVSNIFSRDTLEIGAQTDIANTDRISTSITESTVTPRTFRFSQEQLSNVQISSEQSVQTSPNLQDFITINEKGVQAASELVDV